MVFSVDKAIEEGSAAAGLPEVIRPYESGVTTGDAVYQKSNGKVDQADASTVATSETLLGFVRAIDDPNPNECRVRIHGDLSAFSGLVAGKLYILSTSPGQIVAADDTGNINYPSMVTGSGHVIREVGNALNTTTLFVEPGRDFEEF